MRYLAAVIVLLTCTVADAATARSKNFIITAPTQAFADKVSEAAEQYRIEMAVLWLGKPLRGNWSKPCPIKCKVGSIGAGGSTTFIFNDGHVFGWHMDIQGTQQRILDSVLPHEISHMIFASHFRCPLPRWADEGAATLVEHESERKRQEVLLEQATRKLKRIPLNRLLMIKEYPRDMQDVLTLYAEGYSLSRFLVAHRGEQAFLVFLQDGMDNGWDAAFESHYTFKGLADVDIQWEAWRRGGRKNVQYNCPTGICPPIGRLPPGSHFFYPAPRGPTLIAPPAVIIRPPIIVQPQPPIVQPPIIPPIPTPLRIVVIDVWLENNELFVKYSDDRVVSGGKIEIPEVPSAETSYFNVVFEAGDEPHELERIETIRNGETLYIPPQRIRVRNVDENGNPILDEEGSPVPPAFDAAPLNMPLKIRFKTPLSVGGTSATVE